MKFRSGCEVSDGIQSSALDSKTITSIEPLPEIQVLTGKSMINLPENLRNQLVNLLSAQPEVEKVVLFGSRARGDAEERSDIDLAIAAPTASRRQWLDIVFLLEKADTLLPIDIVRWEEASALLQERILAEGELLYERETEPEFDQSWRSPGAAGRGAARTNRK